MRRIKIIFYGEDGSRLDSEAAAKRIADQLIKEEDNKEAQIKMKEEKRQRKKNKKLEDTWNKELETKKKHKNKAKAARKKAREIAEKKEKEREKNELEERLYCEKYRSSYLNLTGQPGLILQEVCNFFDEKLVSILEKQSRCFANKDALTKNTLEIIRDLKSTYVELIKCHKTTYKKLREEKIKGLKETESNILHGINDAAFTEMNSLLDYDNHHNHVIDQDGLYMNFSNQLKTIGLVFSEVSKILEQGDLTRNSQSQKKIRRILQALSNSSVPYNNLRLSFKNWIEKLCKVFLIMCDHDDIMSIAENLKRQLSEFSCQKKSKKSIVSLEDRKQAGELKTQKLIEFLMLSRLHVLSYLHEYLTPEAVKRPEILSKITTLIEVIDDNYKKIQNIPRAAINDSYLSEFLKKDDKADDLFFKNSAKSQGKAKKHTRKSKNSRGNSRSRSSKVITKSVDKPHSGWSKRMKKGLDNLLSLMLQKKSLNLVQKDYETIYHLVNFDLSVKHARVKDSLGDTLKVIQDKIDQKVKTINSLIGDELGSKSGKTKLNQNAPSFFPGKVGRNRQNYHKHQKDQKYQKHQNYQKHHKNSQPSVAKNPRGFYKKTASTTNNNPVLPLSPVNKTNNCSGNNLSGYSSGFTLTTNSNPMLSLSPVNKTNNCSNKNLNGNLSGSTSAVNNNSMSPMSPINRTNNCLGKNSNGNLSGSTSALNNNSMLLISPVNETKNLSNKNPWSSGSVFLKPNSSGSNDLNSPISPITENQSFNSGRTNSPLPSDDSNKRDQEASQIWGSALGLGI
jgi:hypothetical protein